MFSPPSSRIGPSHQLPCDANESRRIRLVPGFQIWNDDCIRGARRYLQDESIDLIVTDPPYGIDGHLLDKHYHRDERCVVPGYIEVPSAEYRQFTQDWMAEAARVLRVNGSMYVVSGWTRLADILNAAEQCRLKTVNHIVWQYNFGVFTRKKYVSSHYHILLFTKTKNAARPRSRVARTLVSGKPKPFVFNTNCRFAGTKDSYRDMQDVWTINREYRPGQTKNKNQLPAVLVEKMIQYSSNPGDTVCDFFLGGFTTALVAKRLGRVPVGFEQNRAAFAHFSKLLGAAQ